MTKAGYPNPACGNTIVLCGAHLCLLHFNYFALFGNTSLVIMQELKKYRSNLLTKMLGENRILKNINSECHSFKGDKGVADSIICEFLRLFLFYKLKRRGYHEQHHRVIRLAGF